MKHGPPQAVVQCSSPQGLLFLLLLLAPLLLSLSKPLFQRATQHELGVKGQPLERPTARDSSINIANLVPLLSHFTSPLPRPDLFHIKQSSTARCQTMKLSTCSLIANLEGKHAVHDSSPKAYYRHLSWPVLTLTCRIASQELVAFLRAHLMGQPAADAEPETGVLEGAKHVYDNSIDVSIDMWSCKTAANAIYAQMRDKGYSTAAWSEHELHPKAKDEATVAFIFTMDLLNFSFWSELPDAERFAVEYRGRTWTGYWSLVAALQRALEEGWSALPANRGAGCVHGSSSVGSGLSLLTAVPARYRNHGLAFLAG